MLVYRVLCRRRRVPKTLLPHRGQRGEGKKDLESQPLHEEEDAKEETVARKWREERELRHFSQSPFLAIFQRGHVRMT